MTDNRLLEVERAESEVQAKLDEFLNRLAWVIEALVECAD